MPHAGLVIAWSALPWVPARFFSLQLRQGLPGAVAQNKRDGDAAQHDGHEADPRKPGQPALGGQTDVVHQRSGAAGPTQGAAGVGGKELRIRHLQRPGERAGKNSQQRDEAAEEDRPYAPACEEPLAEGDMTVVEVLREARREPVEQRHSEPAADRVPDGVADDGAHHRRSPDRDGVDRQFVVGRQQRGADEDDLPGQWNAKALDADDPTDDEVHGERRDRLQQRVHGHAYNNARSPRRAAPWGMRPQTTRIGVALLIAAAVSACGAPRGAQQPHPGVSQPSQSTVHDADDVAFAQNMIPHHHQAVDMAAMVPTHTADQTMHEIAVNIAADQQAEIKALNALLTRWGAAGGGMSMGGMAGMVDQATMNRLNSLAGPDFDQLWLTAMISHHRGAVTMAQAEIGHGEDPDAIHMASLIVNAQQREIAYMTHLLSKPE